eukprot:scaffold18741_cov158-Skeletonema_marinoi.AAC.2
MSSLQLLECALHEFSRFRFHFPVNQADAAKEQDDRPTAAIILWSELVCRRSGQGTETIILRMPPLKTPVVYIINIR